MSGIQAASPKLEGGLRLKRYPKTSRPGEPLITVVTATFNDAKDLLLTANSIRGLHYKNVEWIVIDGGSGDGTVEAIRQNEGIIDFWLSEPDRGIYDAWNKGVARAKGEWVSFLGAGDRYHPDALDRYVQAIAGRPSTPQLVSSRVRHVNRAGKTLRVWGGELERDKFRKYMPIGHCGALHHRSLFEKHGQFDISYSSASDYEFLMRCGSGLDTAFLDAETTDMLVGGISNSYRGLFETYRIQRRYGESAFALVWLGVACAKRLVRPLLRGY
jgi:glycosyltransferase involved in cell wall biosynthesis